MPVFYCHTALLTLCLRCVALAATTSGETNDGWASDAMVSGEGKTVHVAAGSASHSNLSGKSFHFVVGSIETLDQRLEAVQREIGIPSSQFVPVQYSTEMNYGQELVRLLPTLLLLGGLLFLRNAAKGMGDDGLGKAFKIGKSKAKKVS